MVVADALIDGEISFAIGAHTYTAPINDQGQYQITLDPTNEDTALPFTAIATGAASNSWVQMAALYPSITRLRELAGSDGILAATEYPGVNISAMTTAEYSIVIGNRLPITTDTERKYALLQVEAADILKRAAYLTKHLTDIDIELAPKHTTTLDLLLDKFYVSGQLNLLRQYGDDLEGEITAIKADQSQTYVSKKAIHGKFLLKTESFTYLLMLDEVGTGLLLTSNTPAAGIWANNGQYQQSFFTWIRKGKNIRINLDSPINYGETLGFNNTFQSQCADSSSGISLPICPVTLNSVEISLIDENEVGKIADVQLDVTVKDANGDTVFDVSGVSYPATLLDTSHFYKITEEELQGATWYTNNYSYSFNADGTATQVNSHTKNASVVNWRLDDGQVILDGDALGLLPLYPQGPGFAVMQLLIGNERALFNGAYQQNPFVKRADVSMSSTDWIGRWNRGFENSFSAASDFYENGQFRDGFETQLMGSWTVTNATHISGRSNGAWRMEFELLAIKDGQHYMQHCYGVSTDNFIPSGCVVESYVIDKTFSGTTFWETWSNPLFQNKETGEYWQFWGHVLSLHNPDFYQSRSYIKVAPNLLFDYPNGKILEMFSSNINSVDVCEYDVFSACDEGELFTLERTPELKITISGNGSVSYETREFTSTGSMMVRREAKSLLLQPAAGQEALASNISGCDGTLNGNNYDIQAPVADCEIVVEFTPIP
jgi:hypothetical protein